MSLSASLLSYQNQYRKVVTIGQIEAILQWDSEVFMPEDARENRSQQLAFLSLFRHQEFVSDSFAKILDSLKNEWAKASPDEKKSYPLLERELFILERERNKSTKLPEDLVESLSRESSKAHGIWMSAKKNQSFAEFLPQLEILVELSQRKADCLGYSTEPYDALLDEYEPSAKAKDLELLFSNLKKDLVPLLDQAKYYPNPFTKPVPKSHQERFNKRLPQALGLNPKSSRLDISAHPFSTTLGLKDQRITTRYQENDPLSSIFGVLHETGHSLYEAGLAERPDAPSPLSEALSFGLHESQSRLWENQIGRSRAFWKYYYPVLLEDIDWKESDLPFESLMQGILSSQKTKIRVEADPLTYNLHIILRFELERALFQKEIQVKDLPQLWNEKMKEVFGLEIQNDAEGVLQDVHWAMAGFGYFPTYTLGNIYGAQLFSAFFKTEPGFWDKLSTSGDCSSLLQWLRKQVHHLGRNLDTKELMTQATGEEPSSKYLIESLRRDYL